MSSHFERINKLDRDYSYWPILLLSPKYHMTLLLSHQSQWVAKMADIVNTVYCRGILESQNIFVVFAIIF